MPRYGMGRTLIACVIRGRKRHHAPSLNCMGKALIAIHEQVHPVSQFKGHPHKQRLASEARSSCTMTTIENKGDTFDERAQLREEIAQEKFGKTFDELDSDEKMSVGGTIGGRRGGEARKQQMAEEGTTEEGKMKAYSEMGKSGAMKGGYGNELAHDPELKEKYAGDRNAGGANLD